MSISRYFLALFAAIALWLSGTVPAPADTGPSEAGSDAAGRIVTLGKVTLTPDRARRTLGPIAAHVALQLEASGIRGIRLLFASTNDEMAKHLRAGRVDWITETAASASAFVDSAGAEILARRWMGGAPEYQTIIVARRDSDILTVADLAGKTVAFENPDSTPAYFIPAHAMLQAGLALEQLEAPDAPVVNGSTGYVFSRDKLVTSAWVHEGKVDAGALSNRDWRSEETMPPAYRASFRIIYTSGKFPYALELVRGGLEPEIKAQIRQALQDAHTTRRGRAALRAYNRTARFDEAPAKVTRSIAELRDIRKSIQSRLH